MTYTKNAPNNISSDRAGFGIVFAGGKIHGPTEVDNRGLGGSTKDKIPFMVVPGPNSPYFDRADFSIDGAVGCKDAELGFWSIFCPTQEQAESFAQHLRKHGSL
jgi:hypothetical protein